MSVLNLSSVNMVLLFSLSKVVFSSDGDFTQINARCVFREAHDVEYIEEFHFNKVMMAWYNSTLDKWTGYTPTGMDLASSFNEDIYDRLTRRGTMDILCVANADLLFGCIHNSTFEPYVRLRSVEPFSTRHLAMLVCSAYNFYPKPIRVTWLRDGQEVTADVTSTEELTNGDWTYQIHSHLEYTPTPGERITCMVEHFSLTEPKLYDWDTSMPESERNKKVIGACGLLLGVVCIAAGLIYYRKKSTGLMLVPTSFDRGPSSG